MPSDRRLYPSRALHAQVAHEIGRRIVAGEIGEGENLPREAELAKQFDVSRQAVREALKVLAAKGLVAPRRRTGTTVLPRSVWNLLDPDVLAWHAPGHISPDFLLDLIELRRVIEPAAAALAARRADPERLARLEGALAAMRANSDDVPAFLEADTEFHTAMLSATGNTLFERLSNIIRPALEMALAPQAQSATSFNLAIEQHSAVYDAIARGDSEAARRSMEEILAIAHGNIVRLARDRARVQGA